MTEYIFELLLSIGIMSGIERALLARILFDEIEIVLLECAHDGFV